VRSEPQEDQSRGGVRQIGLFATRGRPKVADARRVQEEDEANGSLLEEQRDEESCGVWEKHGGLTSREDLPKTESESRAYSTRQDCRHL